MATNPSSPQKSYSPVQVGNGILQYDPSKAGAKFAGQLNWMAGDNEETLQHDANNSARLYSFAAQALGLTTMDANANDSGDDGSYKAKMDDWLVKKFGTKDIVTDYNADGKTATTRFYKNDGTGTYRDLGISYTGADAGAGDLAAILSVVGAPIVNMVAPGLSASLGGGAIGKIGAGALVGGGISAVSGQNILKGAVSGGIGASSSILAPAFAPVFGDASGIISKAITGGASAAVKGGNPLVGAITAGASSINQNLGAAIPMLLSLLMPRKVGTTPA